MGLGEGRPILVGLAALNEADTVARVAEAASAGLEAAFPGRPSLVILADNGSSDGTREAFRRARIGVARAELATPPGRTGKGHAVRAILEDARARDAEVVVLLDADLVSVRPGWVGALARPVLDSRVGCDLVTPLYRRDARDGAVTRHLACPLVTALTGLDIRQPIGGDFAVSGRLLGRLLRRDWPASAFGFGVDILLTLEAARAGGAVASAHLGAKVHKPSAPSLARIFREVASTAFALAAEAPFPKEGAEDVEAVAEFGCESAEQVPPVEVDVESFAEVARSVWKESRSRGERVLGRDLERRVDRALGRAGRVDEGLWHDCLLEALRRVREGTPALDAAEALTAPFLGRTADFWEEVGAKSVDEVERMVSEGARRFRALFRSGNGIQQGCTG